MSDFWKSRTAAAALVLSVALTAGAAHAEYSPPVSTATAAPLVLSADGKPLLTLGGSSATYPGDPGTNTGAVRDVELGSTSVPIGGGGVPLSSILNLGDLASTVSSRSAASGATDTDAAAGTLGDAANQAGPLSVDLLALGGAALVPQNLVDNVTMSFGAFSSRTKFVDGELQPAEYRVGQASLLVRSPAVKDAASRLYQALGGVDRQIEKIVSQKADLAPLKRLLTPLGVPSPTLAVQSNTRDKIFAALLARPLTSRNKVVTIDFSTGTVTVHLDQLAGGLNDKPANTELISSKDYHLVTQAIHDVMNDAADIALGTISDSLDAVRLTLRWAGPVGPGGMGGKMDVTWNFTLRQAIDGSMPQPVSASTGAAAPVATALLTTLTKSLSVVGKAFKPASDLVLAASRDRHASGAARTRAARAAAVPNRAADGDNLVELLLKVKFGFTSTVTDMLLPVFRMANQVISVEINHQEPRTCVLPTGVRLPSARFTSAVSINFLKATVAARLDLGLSSGSVTIPNCR
ncbi:choice-of-anchor G family protein [Nonomuraea sp. NN258]|uniref:choice-of-anchor G family protein n=1 Tax=Nonomuraea antri TaxID=2730852 RepID=UPI0015687573|nr:choice-of-anchor G family protein [Nonomuraea antri]NRQ32407.1 choice-of-anchor G family protein [Nonomuraea antri]